MTSGAAVFSEYSAEPKVVSTGLSHLSIELGHLYMEDYAGGRPRLREHFTRVRRWAETATEDVVGLLAGRTARVSTCFLIDDYFTRFPSPGGVITDVLAAAEEAGVRIDYLAREAACARARSVDGGKLIEPVRLMVDRLVDEPPPGTNGARPLAKEVGWLCNGERGPSLVAQAMEEPEPWRPPREHARNRHSIFLDVEMWDGEEENPTWSCPLLAAVWQLLRLGMLRDEGEVVVAPEPLPPPERMSDDWDELPGVMKVNPKAHPFAAYRSFTILDRRFQNIEHAVGTILGQTRVDREVLELIARRAKGERLELPDELTERLDYLFIGRPWTAPAG